MNKYITQSFYSFDELAEIMFVAEKLQEIELFEYDCIEATAEQAVEEWIRLKDLFNKQDNTDYFTDFVEKVLTEIL